MIMTRHKYVISVFASLSLLLAACGGGGGGGGSASPAPSGGTTPATPGSSSSAASSGSSASSSLPSSSSSSTASSLATTRTVRMLTAGYADTGGSSPSYSGHTCAIRTSASATPMCWGQNWDGQFGNGLFNSGSLVPTAASNVPVDAVAITAGQNHACALRSGGSVVCWGFNYDGEAGDGTTASPKTSPGTAAGLSDVKTIASGPYFNCAVMTGKVYCWGQVPLTGAASTPTQVPSVSGATAIAAGANHICAVLSDSSVVCWGSNNLGQLGNGATANYGFGMGPLGGSPSSSTTPFVVQFHSSTTTRVNLTGAVAVAAGQEHSCALMSDFKVKCWGDNNYGALGATSKAPWAALVTEQTSAIEVDGILKDVTQLVAGKRFNCALLSDKTVTCWGANTYGQLGRGTKSTSELPQVISGLINVTAIAAGETHACALLGSGDVKCWGANGTRGNLGNNSTSESLLPVSTTAGAVFGR